MEKGDLITLYDIISGNQVTGEYEDIIKSDEFPTDEQLKYYGLMYDLAIFNKKYEHDRLVLRDLEDNIFYVVPLTDRWEIEIHE